MIQFPTASKALGAIFRRSCFHTRWGTQESKIAMLSRVLSTQPQSD